VSCACRGICLGRVEGFHGNAKLTPYGSLGGLVWNEGSSGSIYIEFGKSPAEAASMRATVLKVFGPKATAAALIRENVMFYTNHGFKVSSHEASTVESCLH
jgi:hypothetical protein